MAPPVDPIDHYNKWQIPFAIIALLIIGFGQFLRYKSTPFRQFASRIWPPLIIALMLTIVLTFFLEIKHPHYALMLFTGLFAFTGNGHFWLRILKGRLKGAGPSLAHIGFALVLVGALISTSQSETISRNLSGIDVSQLGGNFNNQENILLAEGDTLPMGDYKVSYVGQRQEGNYLYYKVHYANENESFFLNPSILLNDRMGNSPEPDTKHYLLKDVYSHVTYAELRGNDPGESKKKETEVKTVSIGDTLFADQAIIVVDSMYKAAENLPAEAEPGDIIVGADFVVLDFNTDMHKGTSYFILRDSSYTLTTPFNLPDVGLEISFTKIFPETGNIELTIIEEKNKRDFIILKAVVFPFINVLWIGIVLMALGTGMAIYQRIRFQRKGAK